MIRRRWLGALSLAVGFVGTGACGGEPFQVTRLACGDAYPTGSLAVMRPCFGAIRLGTRHNVIPSAAIEICVRELAIDRDADLGGWLPTTLSYYPRAQPVAPLGELAVELAAGGQAGAAALVAALRAFDDEADGLALERLQQAAAAGAPACPIARTALSLGAVLCDAGQLGPCKDALELGMAALDGYDDEELRSGLVIAGVKVISATGGIDEALGRTETMLASASAPMERAWLYLVRLDLLYARKGQQQAEVEAWEALKWTWVARVTGTQSDDPRQVESAAYYALTGLFREQRRYDEAERALENALRLTPDDPTCDASYSRALIHRDRGALAQAEQDLIDAKTGGGPGGDGKPPSGDLAWSVPFDLGRVRMLREGFVGAEVELRVAIDEVEQLRANAPGSEGQMIAAYRRPYEELLGLLAHAGRWRDALEVLARLDAGRLNSDVAAPVELTRGHAIPEPVSPSKWLPTWPGTTRTAAGAEALLTAWRGRHLVAVFRGGDDLCRIEADDGELRGACVGKVAVLERAAEALYENPNDEVIARAVGDALIPPGDDGLDLLLVGPIARAPIAALRNEQGLVVGQRPLQRVLGLLDDERGQAGSGRPRVVGYAGKGATAKAAEVEAGLVATQLEVDAAIGDAATRAAVTDAAPVLLHFAGHAHLVDGVPQLELADGSLSVDEIAALAIAPRLVVLASCESATAEDEGGWGSLAAAFLHAGSERVIASDRRVEDEEARALMSAFYGADGAHDPARVLGVSQAARALVGRRDPRPVVATTWAAFTVIAAPPRVPAPPPR